MNPLAAFKVAIAALRLNALRSFLAMLGVIIGVASVIVMVSVASGAGQAIEDRIKALQARIPRADGAPAKAPRSPSPNPTSP